MEYVQEEECLTKVFDEEEYTTALFTSFGNLFAPNHKNIGQFIA